MNDVACAAPVRVGVIGGGVLRGVFCGAAGAGGSGGAGVAGVAAGGAEPPALAGCVRRCKCPFENNLNR